MLTDPETQYQFPSFDQFLTAIPAASKALEAEWMLDKLGRLRAVTGCGEVCCPLTLVSLYQQKIETSVEKVGRILKGPKPLVPPHLLDVILPAVDNRHIMVFGGAMRRDFELDVQLALDQAAGINGKRRHSSSADAVIAETKEATAAA